MSHNSRLNSTDRAGLTRQVADLVKEFGATYPAITIARAEFSSTRPSGCPPTLTSPDGEVFCFIRIVPRQIRDEVLDDPPLGGVIYHHPP